MAEARSPSPAPRGRPVDDTVDARLIEMMVIWRKEVPMRQADLAAKLGQPQSYVSKVERRERRLDVGEYVAWMHALGLDPVAQLAAVLRHPSRVAADAPNP